MNTNYFYILIISLSLTPNIIAQNKKSEIVNKNYPSVYRNIVQLAESSWGSQPDFKEKMIVSQSEAFLSIAEPKTQLDSQILLDAIMDNSLNGEAGYNKQILDDQNIQNAYPLLKCNWFLVKEQYENRSNSQLDIDKTDYLERIQYETKPVFQDLPDEGQTKVDKSVHFGFRVGYGISSLKNLDKYFETKTSRVMDYAIIINGKISKLLFIQTDLFVDVFRIKIDGKNTNEESRLRYDRIGIQPFIGIYKDLSKDRMLMLGAGGFYSMRVASSRNFKFRMLRDEIGVSNYGVSGMAAFQSKHFQVSLVGNWGMKDISISAYGFKSRSAYLTVAYLF